MPTVYVSIGSNIDREQNTRAAVRALKSRFGAVTASSVYESEAEGFAGDNFYNLVATFETDQSVENLREKIGAIETAQGRVRSTARYSARTLDIDILLYGALIRHDAEFDIPRGEILEYAYVLAPLAEIAPTARHPENGATFAELWRRLEPKSAVRRVAFDFSD